jgi:NAD-dependent deacetylase
VSIITQNIDDLHERAGSSNVLHLHGNIRLAKSSGPNQEKKYYSIEGWKLTKNNLCEEGFRLRPHVVWFGELVPAMDSAVNIIKDADYFVVIGTSLQVYPAGLVHVVPVNAIKFVIDPNVDSFDLPVDYYRIKANAIAGVNKFKKILLNSF